MQFSAGSYFKGAAVVLPATSVDTNALLNFTDAQTKTLVEMIELQRKSLDAARREEPTLAPKMLLSGIPQHG